MTLWIIIFAAGWLCALAYFSFSSFRKTHTADDYIFAGSNLGVFLGLLTFAATLFSTFTFMGMPDFFRTHGVGAWICSTLILNPKYKIRANPFPSKMTWIADRHS